jgi:subtilisin family serine protease
MNLRISFPLAILSLAAIAPPLTAGPPVETDPPTHRAPANLDDSIPAPDPAVVTAGPDGDQLVAPRSGDPLFLGFAAGRHYPPKDEKLDPRLGDAIVALGSDGRPSHEVYAFVMMRKRLTEERVRQLQSLGVRVLGAHPHHSLRVAIPVEQLPAVAAHDAVQWVGLARDWQKIHPDLLARMQTIGSRLQDVYVSVFESDLGPQSTSTPGTRPVAGGPDEAPTEIASHDSGRRFTSNGWMHDALVDLGIELREYLPRHHVFRARIRADQLAPLLERDFVHFVEADVPLGVDHDESMPMVLADHLRASFDGGTNEEAIGGIIDSGVDVGHSALDHVYYVAWNESDPGNGDSTHDPCGHGSHVAGTLLGEPLPADASLRGVAPGLATWQSGRFRIVKWHGDDCLAGATDISNVVSHMSGNFVDAFGVSSPQPMVINNSYGTPGSWYGSEYTARVIDDEVYDHDQVYVFSAGNSGPAGGTIGVPGVAKNAFTVGSVYDHEQSNLEPPGTVASSSSRGPALDGRWKPNVVAPGNRIRSVLGETLDDYTNKSGTSMAAPHVSGIVSLLMDRNPVFRGAPERVFSVLQATAITKDDVSLGNPTDSHFDSYGCGRVDASRMLPAVAGDSSWTNWAFVPAATIGIPVYEFADFVVPTNTRRMVVCMSYLEPSSLPGASTALLHDFDLYLDRAPIDVTSGTTGEYFVQQSGVDNTEIRIIDSPPSGPWRWKVFPTNVLVPLFDPAKVSVTVYFIFEDPTPDGALSIVASDEFVRPGEIVDLKASVATDGFIASAVFLDSNATPTSPSFTAATTTLLDGKITNLLGNEHFGRDVLLGDILPNSSREATWSVYWSSEGTMNFAVEALSDNLSTSLVSVNVVVDGTPPTTPSSISSSTHVPNVWSNDTKLIANWPAASDAFSGIEGYSFGKSVGSPSAPDATVDVVATSVSLTLNGSPSPQFLNVRAVDKSGNASSGFTSGGPYLIDVGKPSVAGNLKSTTHVPGVWSPKKEIAFGWTPAPDAASGVAGYSFDVAPAPGLPDATPELGDVVSHTMILPGSPNDQFFNLRAVDAAGNWSTSAATFGPIRIDLAAPTAPSTLQSPTHPVGTSTTAAHVTVNWTASGDVHSGVLGYVTVFDHAPLTNPSGSPTTATTSITQTLDASGQDWYCHVRASDLAGNLSPTAHYGPFRIGVCTEAATATNYGVGKAGQFGVPQLVATTTPILGATAGIEIQFGYPGAFPILLLGTAQVSTPYDAGFLLVSPAVVVPLPVSLSGSGSLSLASELPLDAGLCGASLYLQVLIPDPGAAGNQHLAMTPGLRLTLGS